MTPTTYYKATRPDGTDFQSGTIDYGTRDDDYTLLAEPMTAAERATCQHPDSWFDRSICAADDWMHTYCSVCGSPLDGECGDRELRTPVRCSRCGDPLPFGGTGRCDDCVGRGASLVGCLDLTVIAVAAVALAIAFWP